MQQHGPHGHPGRLDNPESDTLFPLVAAPHFLPSDPWHLLLFSGCGFPYSGHFTDRESFDVLIFYDFFHLAQGFQGSSML